MKKIYLKKLITKGYLVLEGQFNNDNKCRAEEIAVMLKSFSSLGYTLDKEGINMISNLSSLDLGKFYHSNYQILQKFTGTDYNHRIFYNNFPDLADISDYEFYVRAVLHYLTVSKNDIGFMSDDIADINRLEVHNNSKQILKVIDKDKATKLLINIVKDLFEGKVAISYNEESFLLEMLGDYKNEINIVDIPFKENMAKYVSYILRIKGDNKLSKVLTENSLSFVKTATDLLRIYAILSNGDYTLRENTRFISLERSVRRMFLNVLNVIAYENPYMIDDLARHEFLWKRAFEKLHVAEYSKQYPYIARLASMLRNDEYITYYGRLEQAKENQGEFIKLLKTRPGEFARRLDMIIRNQEFDLEYTLSSFKEVANKVSTTLLLQLWEFFKNRELYPTRIFKINGRFSTFYKEVIDIREPIEENVIEKVTETLLDILRNIYSNYDNVGKVYIDENVKSYCLPINNRNASSQNKTLTFGSKVKLEEEDGNYLRFFTHFKNFKGEHGRVDVDLSIEFVDETLTSGFSLSWHNMGSGRKFDSYHSGDITSAPDGASEFVDLDYKKARKYARYAVVTNSVYTGQDFADIPECFSGVMFMPQIGKKGSVFNPEFVKYKFDLTQKGSNQNIAFAVDLETLELIWIDSPMSYNYNSIVASRSPGVVMSLKNALKTHMNLYDFFILHSNHFTLVDNKEEADIIISDSEDATLKPFDVEEIAAKWL